MKEKNWLSHELIGKVAAVVGSKNKHNIGIKGRVVDETKNTITIQTVEGQKKLIKNQSIFKFTINNKKITVNGEKITARPEERIKNR